MSYVLWWNPSWAVLARTENTDGEQVHQGTDALLVFLGSTTQHYYCSNISDKTHLFTDRPKTLDVTMSSSFKEI